MPGILRIINTGLGTARWNVAMTAALTKLHRDGRIADTLRFHRYYPSVLIGRHQKLGQAANVRHGRDRQIEFARRVAGGAAAYMSPGVLAWEFMIAQRHVGFVPLASTTAAIADAIATGLIGLGVAAQYRAPNDVVVDGKKVSGVSGSIDGPSIVLQGSILIDMNFEDMAEALALSAAPHPDTGRGLARQMTTLRQCVGPGLTVEAVERAIGRSVGQTLGWTVLPEMPLPCETALARKLLLKTVGTTAFVFGTPATVGRVRDVHALSDMRV